MSADPPSSSGLPPRTRPVLSDLSKQTTEEDLWDLDEEATPANVPGPAGENPGAVPQTPSIKEKPKPAVIESRLDKPDPKQKGIARMEPPRGKVSDAFGDLDENEERPSAAPENAEIAAPVPTPREEEEALPSAVEKPVERERRPEGSPTPPAAPKFGISRREIVGLGAFAFAILLAAIWGLASFFGHLHFTDGDTGRVDFPVKGERATVAGAESFWREPIREGANRDAARGTVAVIPVVEIVLEPGTGSGALRILFRNDRSEPVGDTITRTFSNGRFDAGGSERTECASTAGFEERGEFNALRAGQTEPWTVLVLEGPGPDAPAREFRTLFEMPLSTLFR